VGGTHVETEASITAPPMSDLTDTAMVPDTPSDFSISTVRSQ
jgi:hypothetical protein